MKNTTNRKTRQMTFNKTLVAYSIMLTANNVFVSLKDIENNKQFLYTMSEISAATITKGQLISIVKNSQLIGFNNKNYDDYLLPLIITSDSIEDVMTLAKRLKESHTPTFLWEDKPKSQFGTFDITASFAKKDIKLSQLSSQFGLPVYPEDIKNVSDEEFATIASNTTETIARTFNHPVIFGSFRQHRAMIEKYLPGEDWAISQTDAALAARALTNKGRLKVTKKTKFDWEFQGVCVLPLIPEQWRNEIEAYGKRMETALVEYEKAVANGMSEREAGLTIMKQVATPDIEPIKMGDHLLFRPSVGGAHTSFVSKDNVRVTSRFRNVHHRDIQGAYGAVAVQTGLFGEATPVFKKFLDDKFEAKRLRRIVAKLEKENNFEFQTLNSEFNLDLTEWNTEFINSLVENEVSSTKLATNSPTGKADEPGSPLYNPIAITENRIILQVLLYLATKLVIDNGGFVLSVNTDGLFYVGNEEVLAPLFDKWAIDWNLKLDYESNPFYIGKDDSSRLILDNKLQVIEASGEISHTEINPKKMGSVPRIVDIAVIEKLIHPKKEWNQILKPYLESNQTDLFAWTLKATKKHRTVVDFKITQLVNRVLLTKTGNTIGNYSIVKDKIEAFTNLPETKVQVINDSIPETIPAELNVDAYIEIIEKAYNNWL